MIPHCFFLNEIQNVGGGRPKQILSRGAGVKRLGTTALEFWALVTKVLYAPTSNVFRTSLSLK